MFAPKTGKAQAEGTVKSRSTREFARQPSTLMAQRPRSAEQHEQGPKGHPPAALATSESFPEIPLYSRGSASRSRSSSADALEQEADRIANRIAQGPLPSIQALSSDRVQRAALSNADRTVSTGNRALPGSGRPLDAATRAYFEPRFG